MHGRITKTIILFLCGAVSALLVRAESTDNEFRDFCDKFMCHCPSINASRHETFECIRSFIYSIPVRFHIPDYYTVVNLQGNLLKELKAGDFEFALGVKELDLSHNELRNIGLEAFKPFEKLQDLNLSHNKLFKLQPGSLNNLQTLQTLDLSYNNLSTIEPNVFARVPDLKKIVLTFNPLKTLNKDIFSFLPKIEQIVLDYNNLESLPDDVFSLNKNLRILSLVGNRFQAVPYTALEKIQSLNSLDLSDNPIKVINSHAFPPLLNFNMLLLKNMRSLKEIKEHAFEQVPHLKILHCSYNPNLKIIHKNAFKNKDNSFSVNLNLLYLQHNGLETLDAGLIEWNNPYFLDLSGNFWNCDCNLKWMSHLETRHEMSDRFRCYQPRNLGGMSIVALDEDVFVCDIFIRRWIFYMLCIFLVLATTLIVGVLFITLLKYGCLHSCMKKKQYYYKPMVNKSATVIIDNEIMDNTL